MNSFLLPKEELIYYVTLRCKWSSSSEGREGSNFWFGVFYIWCLTVQCENDASTIFFFFFSLIKGGTTVDKSSRNQFKIQPELLTACKDPVMVPYRGFVTANVDLLPHIKKHRAIYAFLVGEPQPQSVVLEIVLT